MRNWLQNLSDSLVDRLVPKAEAAAATNCWTEERCSFGPPEACSSSNRKMLFTYLHCADGSTSFVGSRCANC